MFLRYFNFLSKFYFIFIRSITKWQILPYKVIIFNLDNVLNPNNVFFQWHFVQNLRKWHRGCCETTWNHLKPAESSHIIVFLLKISYSQVEFVLILHPKVFFGKIWSQKLKFSKLTKIWYRGTLLYPHFEFSVYFSKIFVTHIFLGKYVSKIWSLQINWDLVQGHIAMYLIWF